MSSCQQEYGCPYPRQEPVKTLLFSVGRLAGLSGALAVAALSRVRNGAEHLVWGFDAGFGPPASDCHRCRCPGVRHEYRIDCVPNTESTCRSCCRWC